MLIILIIILILIFCVCIAKIMFEIRKIEYEKNEFKGFTQNPHLIYSF